MLVDRRALARDARNDDPGLLVRRHGLGFEERRHLVEHGPIAAFAHVAGENIRQPEVRIARLGPLAETGAAARRAMPPFEHVAFAELLARVQHDLRPGQPRLEQGQRQHVLQLVAITGRAAKLVRADAAEQPRGVELVGQPGVDQPVEVRPIGPDLDLAQSLEPRRRASPASSASAVTTPTRAAAASASARVGASPKAIAIFVSPPAAERSRSRRPPRAARHRARRRRLSPPRPSRG